MVRGGVTWKPVAQELVPQHPRVEVERLSLMRTEEGLRGHLQRVQRQARALRVRPRVLEHHVGAGVEAPPGVLETGPEGRGVDGLREAQRRGPDGLMVAGRRRAVAARLLPHQRLYGETLLTAVLEHGHRMEGEVDGSPKGMGVL